MRPDLIHLLTGLAPAVAGLLLAFAIVLGLV